MSVELMLSIVSAVAAIFAGYWALVKLVVRLLDERFAAQERSRQQAASRLDDRQTDIEQAHRRHEREFLEMKADLPLHYVRREDYVRNQTVIEAKLDALALKFENWNLKGGRDA